MNYVKRILCVVFALCMTLALVACGGSNQAGSSADPGKDAAVSSGAASSDAVSSDNEAASTDDETPADDGKVTYTATVLDENGDPVSGIMIQICKDVCMPAVTDADGVATWSLEEDDYKVSFPTSPEGYVDYTGSEFYFDEGSTEMTIILTPAQ